MPEIVTITRADFRIMHDALAYAIGKNEDYVALQRARGFKTLATDKALKAQRQVYDRLRTL